MPKINAAEGQTLEFKRQWADRALEDLAAFANTDGGTLLLGIRDDGEIVGARADDRELQRIANLRWGTGTTRIIRLCREQELPEPEFANWQGGFRVTFLQDPYTPERLRRMGLNERQIRIVAVLRDLESASVSELHRRFPDVSSKTIQRDLQALVKRGLVKALGDKKGRRYVLAR